MVSLGEHGYELLRRGVRPRSVHARRLTPQGALRRLRSLSRDATIRQKIMRELEAAGMTAGRRSYEDLLEAALQQEKVALYRRVILSPSWAGGIAPPVVSLIDLITETLEPEAEPTPEAAPSPASLLSVALEGAAAVMASALSSASESGDAVVHACLDCPACRGETSASATA